MQIVYTQQLVNFQQEKQQKTKKLLLEKHIKSNELKALSLVSGGSVWWYYGGIMKKAIYILLDLLTAAFMIGAYVIQYFTKRKLGMLRWVNYQNMQFQKNAAYGILKYITAVVALVLILVILKNYRKKKARMKKTDYVMMLIMSILEIAYLYVTIFWSTEKIASYYLLMPLIGAAVLMQIIRNGIAVGTKKNEK